MEIFDNDFKTQFSFLKIDKSSLDFFDIIPPKEILVSKWLEFILDPNNNGIGNLSIKKILELINKNYYIDELNFISIDTEVVTDTNKRMDIVIKYDGLWIIIENKIDSYENGEQTMDYYNYIEKIRGLNNVEYIYLKPNYNNSSPKNKEFKIITYDELINKLKEISENDYNQKEKYKYKYLKEFIISGGRFMKNKNEKLEFSDSLKFYINNIDKFEMINNEYINKNKQLISNLSQAVQTILNAEENKYSYSKGIYGFIQFFKSSWKNENHTGAHFEIMFSNKNILGKKIKTEIVLHLEQSLNDEDITNFEKRGITKKGSLAYYDGNHIKETHVFDFSTTEKIQESIDKIANILKKYSDNYEKLIDDSLNKS